MKNAHASGHGALEQITRRQSCRTETGCTRRDFIARGTAGLALFAACRGFAASDDRPVPEKVTSIRRLQRPVAIAMWDFCWLVRRYPGGGFEDWGRTLDELAERGYNAVRIDAFPHMVSLALREPARTAVRFAGAPAGSHVLWGNDVDVTVDVCAALQEFLPMCRQRGIKVSLSTWFRIPSDPTIPRITNLEQLTGCWDDTLGFLERHGLMRDILFVDLANEFPFFNGFKALRLEAERAARIQRGREQAGDEHMQVGNEGVPLSTVERSMYRDFSAQALRHFRTRWPQFDVTLSHSANMDAFQPGRYTDIASMDVLDLHVWFGHHPAMSEFDQGKAQSLTLQQREAKYTRLKNFWRERGGELIQWLDATLGHFAQLEGSRGCVRGNTEGWGLVGWDDLPGLDWDFMKKAGDLGVDLARKHGFKFICTSNFTHPHFKRLWADVAWHRAATARIRA